MTSFSAYHFLVLLKKNNHFRQFYISKAKLIVENQQAWRVENSDLKESLETIQK
jgi:putative heme degradation protein